MDLMKGNELMVRERDHLNQVELDHITGRLTLPEMQDIADGKEPTTKCGELVAHKIRSGFVSMSAFKGVVVHVEECLTNNLMEQWQ
jgi:hypothetical protein